MADIDPDPNLSEYDEEKGFPWAIIIGIIVGIAIVGGWLMHMKAGKDSVRNALQQELMADKTSLDAERQKVFDLTSELEGLKQKIAQNQVADRKAAVAQYNQVAAEQRTQREKVEALSVQYNAKVEQLENLQ